MEILRPDRRSKSPAFCATASRRNQTNPPGRRVLKDGMAGPVVPGGRLRLHNCGLHSVLQYDPTDLTISVGAGMRWAELTAHPGGATAR